MFGLKGIRRSRALGVMFVLLLIVACDSGEVRPIRSKDIETKSLEQAGISGGRDQDPSPVTREGEQTRTTAGLIDPNSGSNNTTEVVRARDVATNELFLPSGLALITSENVNGLQVVATLFAPRVYWTRFSPDSEMLATIAQQAEDRRWSVQIWDLTRGLALYSVEGGPGIFFSPEGSRLATADAEEGFYLFHTAGGENAGYFETPGALALSPDWSTMVSNPIMDKVTDSSVLLMVDTESGSVKSRLEVPGTVVDARFSSDGRQLAITTGGVKSETTVWNVDQGERLAMLEMVDRFIFSPDGRLIAGTFGPEREIRLLDATDYSRRLILDNSAGPQPQMLAFSAGGEILAAALGNKLRLWDTLSGEELMSFPVQASNIQFSPDSRLLVTSNFQGEVTLWGVLK